MTSGSVISLEKEMAIHSSISCLGKSMDRGCKESNMTEHVCAHAHAHTHTHTHTHTQSLLDPLSIGHKNIWIFLIQNYQVCLIDGGLLVPGNGFEGFFPVFHSLLLNIHTHSSIHTCNSLTWQSIFS